MPSPITETPVDRRLRRVRELARILDSAFRIPGTGIRVGLDALVGLLPAGGDVAGAVLSGAIVLAAARWGAPPSLLARMIGNLVLDVLLGALPVIGDLIDVGWKANLRNVELLESHLGSPGPTRRRSRWAVAGVAAIFSAIVLLLALGAYGAVRGALVLFSGR